MFARHTGEAALDTADQVRTRWEEIKTEERGGGTKPKTLLSGIPAALPALLRAYQIGSRAASVGFDWSRADDVVAKIREEVDEIQEVVDAGDVDQQRAEEEMGDLLFAIANLSRKLGIEPRPRSARQTTNLRGGLLRWSRRSAPDRTMREMTLNELEREWQRAKAWRSTCCNGATKTRNHETPSHRMIRRKPS